MSSGEDMRAAILADLAAAGYDYPSIGTLRESGTRYTGAVPVLLRWLPRTEPYSGLQETVVRALTVPWARPAAVQPLLELFRSAERADQHPLRWAVGNALQVLGDDTVYDDLVDIANNRDYGTGRQMVVLGLGTSKRPEVVDVLIGLLEDPDVFGHAAKALAKLKDPRGIEALRPLTTHERTWVRNVAKKAVAKLDAHIDG